MSIDDGLKLRSNYSHVRPRCPAVAILIGWRTGAKAGAKVATGYKTAFIEQMFFFLFPSSSLEDMRCSKKKSLQQNMVRRAPKTQVLDIMVRRTSVSDTCLRLQIPHCTQPKWSSIFTYDLR